ncbi:MAG TPA: DUF983 domain-containing protein [Planctomycetota bacterium]|nr:DUF983 domain-containing protein [Planctomycetota bacterium]
MAYDPALAADRRFGPLLKAALRLRCVVCKQGKIFRGWFRYAERCPACGAPVCREQGYFLGSIYVNYGLTVVVTLIAYFASGAAFEKPTIARLWPLAAFSVIFPLWFLRYARSLWAALDQAFDPRVPPG